MAKIKRYKLKENLSKEYLMTHGLREGGSWIDKNSDIFISKNFYIKDIDFEFSINIGINSSALYFDDFDNVLVLDEAFCQPYTPFYDECNYGKEIRNFKALENVINYYNEFMDSLDFLEEWK